MIIFIICVLVTVYLMLYLAMEERQLEHQENLRFLQSYTEDIDMSLTIKGYPGVTDNDIRFTELQAQHRYLNVT